MSCGRYYFAPKLEKFADKSARAIYEQTDIKKLTNADSPFWIHIPQPLPILGYGTIDKLPVEGKI